MPVQNIRTYEVSVWTLQDDFLTVLKPVHTENKGQIQMPKMPLGVDGTQQFEFKIPIYIYDKGKRIENPIWYTTQEGIFIENLRKIKVIFNKDTQYEDVFEFIVTKVTDEHTNDELYCNVTCEGLAFNELGKVGYKISLSTEAFYELYDKWFFKEEDAPQEEPVANINYWLKQFLEPLPASGFVNPMQWYYSIEMDWGSYESGRISSKIYDDAYVGEWNVTKSGGQITGMTPKTTVETQEKYRLVDIEESNIYNITQALAETFGVFCRYEYEHDQSYHITKRKVVFYNHFFYENEGYLDVTYPYSTSSIKREIESGDLVTKMFVKPIDSVDSDSNLVTIMNVPANKSKEDYLLNFEYLHDIETISEEQYQEIDVYEAKMREYNIELISLEQQIIDVTDKITPVRAQKTLSENAVALDQERLSTANDLLNNLVYEANKYAIENEDDESGDDHHIPDSSNHDDSNYAGGVTLSSDDDEDPEEPSDREIDNNGNLVIHVTENNPDTAILLYDQTADSYYIKLSKQGIVAESIKLYRVYELLPVNGNNNSEEKQPYRKQLVQQITTGYVERDEFGEIVRVVNLYKNDEDPSLIYLTYDYIPKLYYQRVINTWTNRLAKDQADLAYATEKLGELEDIYEGLLSDYNALLVDKKADVKAFERMMGPALREGYWQPENFTDYGDHYQDTWSTLQTSSTGTAIEGNEHQEMDYFTWDTEPLYDEQLSYYYSGVEMNKCFYPCVKIPQGVFTYGNNLDIDVNKARLKALSYMFYDYQVDVATAEAGRRRLFTVGSQCQLGFTLSGGAIVPILILTGVDSLTQAQMNSNVYLQGAMIGALEVTQAAQDEDKVIRTTDWSVAVTSNDFIIPGANGVPLVYPRIVVRSMSLKKDSNKLFLGYNMNSFEQYEDFYITSRVLHEENDLVPAYLLTLKPTALLRYGSLDKSLSISYIISNADISIYLDAVKVLRENAYPKVSYQIDVNLVDEKIMRQAYKMLSHLVHINDIDLKFKNVRGYISKVILDLDKPWEDKYEIKNYRNKFEDLFSSIVAQTAAMKSSSGLIDLVGSSFTGNGEIDPTIFQNSLRKIDLNYAFNHGKLTIDEENGIWGISEAGVVAFRGGGIFTSTKKDSAGNWIWNTGIVPQGINADLITTGQLDTNRVMVYAGDKLRFQLNGDGLFAYKSFFEDLTRLDTRDLNPSMVTNVNKRLEQGLDVDSRQFIKLDANGLFFIVKKDALILNKTKDMYLTIDGTKRDAFGYENKVTFTKDGVTIQLYDKDGIPFHDQNDAEDALLDEDEWIWYYDENYRLVEYELDEEHDETISDVISMMSESAYGKFTVPENGIKRVALTWDGFTIRNYNNEKVFYIDADTGNLYIKGRLVAEGVYVTRGSGEDERTTSLPKYMDDSFEDHVQVSKNLQAIFEEAGEVLETGLGAINDLANLTLDNKKILTNFYNDILNGLKDDRIIQLYGSSSVDIYTGTADDPSTFSVFSLSADKGVWIGSNKAINLFANNIGDQTTAAGASVSINPDYILFGVNSTGSTTAVKMTKNLIVLAAANQLSAAEAATPYTIENSSVSGLKITPDALWLATGSGSSRSLVSMQPQGITIGIAAQSGNSGSFIKMTKDEMIIGASTNLYIRATNVALDNNGARDTATTYPDSLHQNTYFRLGTAGDPGLLFDGVNLWIKGNLFAANTYIVDTNGDKHLLDDYLDDTFETSAEVVAKLEAAFDEAGEIIKDLVSTLNGVHTLSEENREILASFLEDVGTGLKPEVFTTASRPTTFKPGDVWEPASGTYAGNKYIAGVYSSEAGTTHDPLGGWNKVYDGTLASIKGAGIDIDAAEGTIDMYAGSKMTLRAKSQLDLASGDIQITGNHSVNIGSKWINIGTVDGGISIINSDITNNTSTDLNGEIKYDYTSLVSNASVGQIAKVGNEYYSYNGLTWVSMGNSISSISITKGGIVMSALNGITLKSDKAIDIKSASNENVSAIRINRTEGIYLGSTEKITLFSGDLPNSGTTNSIVELSKDRLLFGINSSSDLNVTAIEMTKDYIIAGTADLASLKTATLEFSGMAAGLKITKDGFGFAAVNSTNKSVVLINSSGITIASGASSASTITGSIITISPTELSFGSSAKLSVVTSNCQINTLASTGEVLFGLGTNLNGNNPDYQLKFQDGVLTINGTLAVGSGVGGWTIAEKSLYSGSSSTYVALNSDSTTDYAIWAGSETNSSAPFSVKRDGTVTLTKLLAKAQEGDGTEVVNLKTTNLWRLNKAVKTLEVVDKELHIALYDNTSINFKKANAYGYSILTYTQNAIASLGGTVSIGIYDEEDTLLSTPQVILTPNNLTYTVGVMATADGGDHSASGTIDLKRWYDSVVGTWDGSWSSGQATVAIPAKTDGTSRDIVVSLPPRTDATTASGRFRTGTSYTYDLSFNIGGVSYADVGILNATDAFSNGSTAGKAAISLTSSSWSGGQLSIYKYDTETQTNLGTATVQLAQDTPSWTGVTCSIPIVDNSRSTTAYTASVTLPYNTVSGDATYSSGSNYSINCTINGLTFSNIGTLTATEAYNSGSSAVGFQAISGWENGSNTVTLTNGKTRAISLPPRSGVTISASFSSNSTSTYNLSCSLGGGTYANVSTFSADNAYQNGWIAGYNAAAGITGRSINVITAPSTTSAYDSKPTKHYTATFYNEGSVTLTQSQAQAIGVDPGTYYKNARIDWSVS